MMSKTNLNRMQKSILNILKNLGLNVQKGSLIWGCTRTIAPPIWRSSWRDHIHHESVSNPWTPSPKKFPQASFSSCPLILYDPGHQNTRIPSMLVLTIRLSFYYVTDSPIPGPRPPHYSKWTKHWGMVTKSWLTRGTLKFGGNSISYWEAEIWSVSKSRGA